MVEITNVIAWPVAVLVTVVLLALIFRHGLLEALARWRGFKGFGIDADLTGTSLRQVEAQKKVEEPLPPQLPPPKLPQQSVTQPPAKPPASVLYESFDSNLRARLEEAFPNDKNTQVDWAIRVNSQTLVERVHETHYRVIFGSQIAALKALNQLGAIPIERGRELYNLAATSFPAWFERMTFENWYGFLLISGYVERLEGDNARLTNLGKDFIIWMAARGVLENKPG